MKPRILINIHYLELGGAETALIGLIHSLCPSRVDVDLMINDKRGELLKYIPDWVNVLDIPADYSLIESPIKECVKKGYIKLALARLWAKYKFRRYKKEYTPKDDSAIYGFIGKYVTPALPSLKNLGVYDLAISWLTPHNIVIDKISAKKKVCWIHTDYKSIDVNKEIELPIWKGYDNIVSISDKVSETFCSLFPELKNKIIKIENFLPVELIKQKAEEFLPFEMTKKDDEINFLTIGRYSYAKNLESIPLICKSVREKNINLKWYIIGYGGSDDYIREEIKHQNMGNHVFILGKKENPYPYIKVCDWYVQPSRYEGKSITVREAQSLGKPVIITDYPTSDSQIKNGVNGVIVSLNPDETASQIVKSILNRQLRENIINNIKNTADYSLSNEVDKFYSLLEE